MNFKEFMTESKSQQENIHAKIERIQAELKSAQKELRDMQKADMKKQGLKRFKELHLKADDKDKDLRHVYDWDKKNQKFKKSDLSYNVHKLLHPDRDRPINP